MGEAQLDAVAARSDLLRQEYGILAQLAFEQHDRTSDHSSSFLMASSIMLSAVTLFVKEPKDPADIAGVAWVAGLSGLALCSMWFLTMSRIRNEVNYWYDQLRDREAQLGRAQDGIFSRGKRELQEPGGFRVIHAVALLPVVFSLLYAALIGWKGGSGVWPWAASAGIWFGGCGSLRCCMAVGSSAEILAFCSGVGSRQCLPTPCVCGTVECLLGAEPNVRWTRPT